MTANDVPIILGFDNYHEWRLEMEQKLLGAGVLEWAAGPVPPCPNADGGDEWRENQREARKIIVNSLSRQMFKEYRDLVLAGDTHALWESIENRQTALLIPGGLHYSIIRSNLEREEYVPAKESLKSFVTRLKSYQTKLAGDINPPTDTEINDKIIRSLPKAGLWLAIAITLQNSGQGLDATVQQLANYEIRWKDQLSTVPTAPIPAVNVTEENRVGNNRGRGRGRGRGGRGPSRGPSRGRGGGGNTEGGRVEKGGKGRKKLHYN